MSYTDIQHAGGRWVEKKVMRNSLGVNLFNSKAGQARFKVLLVAGPREGRAQKNTASAEGGACPLQTCAHTGIPTASYHAFAPDNQATTKYKLFEFQNAVWAPTSRF